MASAASESLFERISDPPMLSCTAGARIRSIICADAVELCASRVGATTATSSAKTLVVSETWTSVTCPETTSMFTSCSAYPPSEILIWCSPTGSSRS